MIDPIYRITHKKGEAGFINICHGSVNWCYPLHDNEHETKWQCCGCLLQTSPPGAADSVGMAIPRNIGSAPRKTIDPKGNMHLKVNWIFSHKGLRGIQ